jgi:hypothetical protein
MLLRGPVRDEVGIGDQNAGRVGVGVEDRHGFPGLDEERLIILQLAQRRQDGVQALPVAGGLTSAAVDHQILGPFGHLGIQIVLEHPVGGLGEPRLAAERGPSRGADCSRVGHPDLLASPIWTLDASWNES